MCTSYFGEIWKNNNVIFAVFGLRHFTIQFQNTDIANYTHIAIELSLFVESQRAF